MAVYKVNVDEEISMVQRTRWFVEAESEQQAIDKVVRWIKTDMENVGEDLVDIETREMYGETEEHVEWIIDSIECEGLRSKDE